MSGEPENVGSLSEAGSVYLWSLAPVYTLDSSISSVSVSQGGIAHLTIDFDAPWASQPYRTLLSGSGTGPTTYGVEIPLTRDALTDNSYRNHYPFQVHASMHGILDMNGQAQAHIAIPAGAYSGAVGRTLHLATVVTPPGSLPTASTNAVSITLVP